MGKREADLLVQVYRLSGEQSWVLIHIEVQSQQQRPMVLEERMWVYASRIRLRYKRPVCCLVVLADLVTDWKPNRFLEKLWGCEMSLRFPTVKLLELEKCIHAQPELARNPFALIVRAHMAAKRSKQVDEGRRIYKKLLIVDLARSLREKRLDVDPKRIFDLLRVIDGLLSLSPENDKIFRQELAEDEEIKHMPQMTSFERWGREDGLKEGRAESLKVVLEARFGVIPKDLADRLEHLESNRLEGLLPWAATTNSLDEFLSKLNGQS